MVVKCKACKIYRRMCDVHGGVYLSKQKGLQIGAKHGFKEKKNSGYNGQ